MFPRGVLRGTSHLLLYVFIISQQAALVSGDQSLIQNTDVISAEAKTNVYKSSNDTTVVEISTANAHGLSHNKFLDYNVTSKGVVLNNTVASGITHASKLAGSISANQYSNKQADVILNEVITANRSELRGYTEVVGKNAEVIIANPNGITCDGCGFINTDNVSLTTGNPIIDGTGKLNGFEVREDANKPPTM